MQSIYDFFSENKNEIVAGAVAGGIMFGAIRFYQKTQNVKELEEVKFDEDEAPIMCNDIKPNEPLLQTTSG